MQLVVYTQYYRCKTADRQREIDECLRRNLNHPGIRKLVLFKESDAPPLPQATVELEVVESNERITYAEWFRWVQRQGSGVGLLLNADIYLDEGLEHLAATFDTPETFLSLTRYNPGHAGFHLNDYPHWTQDVWGVRADAELTESLLYASGFQLGFPSCDNSIAYGSGSVHLQASTAHHYDKTSDRLYGTVSYVHPSLAPAGDAKVQFTLWTRSRQRSAGLLVNQQSIAGEAEAVRYQEKAWIGDILNQLQLSRSSRGRYHPFSKMNPEDANHSAGHKQTSETNRHGACRQHPESSSTATCAYSGTSDKNMEDSQTPTSNKRGTIVRKKLQNPQSPSFSLSAIPRTTTQGPESSYQGRIYPSSSLRPDAGMLNE